MSKIVRLLSYRRSHGRSRAAWRHYRLIPSWLVATPKTTLAAASVAVELSYNKKIDKALTHHCVRSSLAAQALES